MDGENFTFRIIGGAADKSLARPGRKQATTTTLWIYSTYSSRSSVHFLARFSIFCKPSESCPSNQVSATAMTSASDEKWRPYNCFSAQGTGCSPTGPDPEKIISEEYAVLILKNRGEYFSSGFLHSEFFGAGWAAMPPLPWLLLCLRVIVI